MNARINPPISAFKIFKALTNTGHKTYFVGGCIRDRLLGREPHDWDISTSALPMEVHAVAAAHNWPVYDTGIQHGTVTVNVDGDLYEVTTFRGDGEYSDGRHPDSVRFTTSFKEDVMRRDFTINALGWNPLEGVVDYVGGVEDLRKGLIRCVGDPRTRFREDGLRVLRAVRFAIQLNFGIERETQGAVFVDGRFYTAGVSMERRRDELMKMLAFPNVSAYFTGRAGTIVELIIPELCESFCFPQNNPHHYLSVWDHEVESMCSIQSRDPLMKLVMLMHDMAKPRCAMKGTDGFDHFYGHAEESANMAKEAMTKLHFSNKEIEFVTTLIRLHDQQIEPTEKAVRKLVGKIGPDMFANLLLVKRADIDAQSEYHKVEKLRKLTRVRIIFKKILSEQKACKLSDLTVNGSDILALGFKPGPNVGIILNKLLDAVIEGKVENDKESLINMVTQL